jgi:predicted acyltransferase
MTESQRLLSLDAFRGFTMAAMVLVENPGTWPVYRQLYHAKWGEPITFTDWIMPFFLFAMGISIVLSLTKRRSSGAGKSKLIQKVILRSLLLFGLGILLHLFYFVLFGRMRIPGILQRIALVYFFCALLFLLSSRKIQIFSVFILLIGYWLLMTLIPVPGIGPANLEPDTNLAAWMDQTLMGSFLRNPRSDPQGLLSTLPSIAIGLIGMLAGQWLLKRNKAGKKAKRILLSGVILIVVGWVWGLVFPMIRELWTSSYVLFTAGIALAVWGAFYWLVDVKGYKRWTKPFAVYGVSCILIFVISHVVGAIPYAIRVPVANSQNPSLQAFFMRYVFQSWLNPQSASLAFAICVVLFWLIPLWIMYNKRIYIKI